MNKDNVDKSLNTVLVTSKWSSSYTNKLVYYLPITKENAVAKAGLNLEVPGKRPRGQTKQRWFDTIHIDLKAAGVHHD